MTVLSYLSHTIGAYLPVQNSAKGCEKTSSAYLGLGAVRGRLLVLDWVRLILLTPRLNVEVQGMHGNQLAYALTLVGHMQSVENFIYQAANF